MELYSLTDIGRNRKHNEDSVYHDEHLGLAVVSDGLGGHQAGELASKKAIQFLLRELRVKPRIITRTFLLSVVRKISDRIFHLSLADEHYDGMGATLVFALKRRDRIYITNIGDSRAYLYRGGILRQVTIDHSHVQNLLERGEISAEEMRRHPLRNLITKSLGMHTAEDPDIFDIALESEDLILLCSDGLTNMVPDAAIRQTLSKPQSLKKTAKQLVALANKKGGKDNISVSLIRVSEKDLTYED